MEFEQVEYGCRAVTEAIKTQDINGYFDLLSPEVLLVSHFPYPPTSSDSNLQAVQRWMQLMEQQKLQQQCRLTASTPANPGDTASRMSSTVVKAGGGREQRRRARELLQQLQQWHIVQQQRYDAFRKKRERHHLRSAGDEKEKEVALIRQEDGAAAGSHRDGSQGVHDAKAAQAAGQRRRDRGDLHKPLHGSPTGDTAASARSAGDTVVGTAAALRARAMDGVRWYQDQQQQPSSQATPSTLQAGVGGVPSPTASTPAATAVATVGKGGGARPKRIPYEEGVTLTEGKLFVSYRFFELLQRVAAASDKNSSAATSRLAPIEFEFQLRKDILQEEEVLPPPAAPTTVQEAYAQLGKQYTDRNQPLSCLRIVWGAEHLLFQDRIFFDDGLIVTIQRTMLAVPEVLKRAAPTLVSHAMPGGAVRGHPAISNSSSQQQQQPQSRLSEKRSGGDELRSREVAQNTRGADLMAARPEQVHRAVEDFYGVTATRVSATNNTWPLLDFSFEEVPEPSVLLRLRPTSGHTHVNRPPRAASDPGLAQGVFLNQENDPAKPNPTEAPRTLIKARNKHGEEEAYEFESKQRRFSMFGDDDDRMGGDLDGFEGAGDRAGASKRRRGKAGSRSVDGSGAVRYDASCVRISGCHMQDKMEQLIPVLRRLVANCILTLHTLDLSQNNISSLPDLRLLPLQNLKLHGNAIADWRVVETQIAPLPYLTILTLHGNPIAEATGVKSSDHPTHGSAEDGVKTHSRGAGAVTGSGGESVYWKRLLAMLLSHPARVAPLRQLDFVTLTGLDYNVAGAYQLFTSGETTLLNGARSMMGSRVSRQPMPSSMKKTAKHSSSITSSGA